MTRVFIGGSRAVSKLNAAIREQLENLVARRCEILIGDASGADRAVQQYLAQRGYRSVTVFCAGASRNNVGEWEERSVQPASTRRDFAYYAAKDVVMAQQARCGIMLWDGKSKGTLHNLLNLTRAGKPALVYFAPEKKFHRLENEEDLQALMARCGRPSIGQAAGRPGVVSVPRQSHPPLHGS